MRGDRKEIAILQKRQPFSASFIVWQIAASGASRI